MAPEAPSNGEASLARSSFAPKLKNTAGAGDAEADGAAEAVLPPAVKVPVRTSDAQVGPTLWNFAVPVPETPMVKVAVPFEPSMYWH